MSYRGRRTRAVERVTEGSLEGYALKDTWVTEKSLEGYVLKDTPVNVLERKDTPVNGLQRKVNLSPSRSREWNIVSPRFLCWRKAILLESAQTASQAYMMRGSRRKSDRNFSAGYVLEPVHPRYTSRLPWAG